MFKFIFYLIFVLLININVTCAQNQFKILFYNVENYFDTWDDPITNDDDFTPTGSYSWTKKRFIKKRNSIYKALVGVSNGVMPDIIGLCEVENRYVLKHLTDSTPLSKYNYGIVHKDSPDPRGIDVALLYQKSKFRVLLNSFYTISNELKTREILYVKGLNKWSDTLHIFVNHWPSKRGGSKRTEKNRFLAAKVLRSIIDSILVSDPLSNICIMGDFNDYSSSMPIKKGLKALSDFTNIQTQEIYNLSLDLEIKGEGSIMFKNKWELIDLFFVSGNLLDKKNKIYTSPESVKILKESFLLEDKANIGVRPKRTYLGPKYNGGYSDHLPVQLLLYKNNKSE